MARPKQHTPRGKTGTTGYARNNLTAYRGNNIRSKNRSVSHNHRIIDPHATEETQSKGLRFGIICAIASLLICTAIIYIRLPFIEQIPFINTISTVAKGIQMLLLFIAEALVTVIIQLIYWFVYYKRSGGRYETRVTLYDTTARRIGFSLMMCLIVIALAKLILGIFAVSICNLFIILNSVFIFIQFLRYTQL